MKKHRPSLHRTPLRTKLLYFFTYLTLFNQLIEIVILHSGNIYGDILSSTSWIETCNQNNFILITTIY